MWSDEKLIEIRRHLHAHPELSTEERATAAYIAEVLEGLGLEPEVGAHGAETGVVAIVEGEGGEGPTLAWRADTDALPIQEATGAAYASCNPGVMHACGHDVHTTVGLGVAASLVAQRGRLKGRVKLIFQPAEEGAPGEGLAGAEAMVEGGVLESPEVDAVFALHCMPSIEVGQIGFQRGAVWAGSDAWRLTIKGRQTHGAYPQDGVDPIYVAGQIVVALQSIPGRMIDSREACVVSVGRIEAGEAFNIIPESAHMIGLLRTLDEGVRTKALGAMRRLFEGICAAHGAEAQASFSRGAQAVVNDPRVVSRALEALERSGATLVGAPPQMGAEDFSSFSMRRPSAYFLLGTGNASRGLVHPIHSPHFDVDERCIPLAVEAFSGMILDLSEGWRAL